MARSGRQPAAALQPAAEPHPPIRGRAWPTRFAPPDADYPCRRTIDPSGTKRTDRTAVAAVRLRGSVGSVVRLGCRLRDVIALKRDRIPGFAGMSRVAPSSTPSATTCGPSAWARSMVASMSAQLFGFWSSVVEQKRRSSNSSPAVAPLRRPSTTPSDHPTRRPLSMLARPRAVANCILDFIATAGHTNSNSQR